MFEQQTFHDIVDVLGKQISYATISEIQMAKHAFPAETGDGTGHGSSTVTFLYPLRASYSAVEAPQVLHPTISILLVAESRTAVMLRQQIQLSKMMIALKNC